MNWRDCVRRQLPQITGDAARDAEIVDELAQHLALRFEEVRATGASDDEALRRVSSELRSRADLASAIRRADRVRPAAPAPPPVRAGGPRPLTGLAADVRYALRLLRRTPGFTAAALLTLALGIGMTTAIFSVVQAVLLRPVPFPERDRLVMMWETDRHSGTTREGASIQDFVDYRDRGRQVERVGTFTSVDLNLAPDRGDPMRLSALLVTRDLMEVLGVRTIAGRPFSVDEDRAGGPPAPHITAGRWERLFARDPGTIGASVRFSGAAPRTIVGVVSSTADFGVLQILSSAAYARGFADRNPRARVDVWLPLQPDPAVGSRGSNHGYFMVGRLAGGATVESARAEMEQIAADLEATYPNDNDGRGAFLEPLDDVVLGSTRQALTVLMAAVTLVLLIACVNVANLLLARAAGRGREIAVRSALGAELPRLARQFVVENASLTLGAAALGVPLAYAVLRALVAVGPPDIPRLTQVSLDARVLLVTLSVSVLIGVVFGMLPVLQAYRTEVQTALKAEGGRGATGGREGRVVRSALVVGEVALAVVLLAGAGLLIRSFWHLRQTHPGFEVSGVLKAEFQTSAARYRPDPAAETQPAAYNRFVDRVLERVQRLPGVEAAALAANHPLDTGFSNSFVVVGREAEARDWPELWTRFVTPSYFETLRVPLVRGRVLDDADTAPEARSLVVNQATADRFFAGQDPIGQQIRFWGMNFTVVGVVGNERFHGVASAAPIGAYVPLSVARMETLALVVRTATDPVALAPAVRAAMQAIDPQLPVFGLEPLEHTLAESLGEQRFMMLLLALFGALAVVLAAIGVHGVLTYLVAQRTHEIGVRMALGATTGRVTRLVVGQGARLVAIGLAVGLAMALILGRSLTSLLYGVTPTDARTLAAVVFVLATVATLAVWLPARRAVRVDPLLALRQE